MAWIRRLLIACMLVACAGTAWAQQPASPAGIPAGMTREQFDALVEAISKSVAERIKAAPAADAAKPAAAGAPAAIDDLEAASAQYTQLQAYAQTWAMHLALGVNIADIEAGISAAQANAAAAQAAAIDAQASAEAARQFADDAATAAVPPGDPEP